MSDWRFTLDPPQFSAPVWLITAAAIVGWAWLGARTSSPSARRRASGSPVRSAPGRFSAEADGAARFHFSRDRSRLIPAAAVILAILAPFLSGSVRTIALVLMAACLFLAVPRMYPRLPGDASISVQRLLMAARAGALLMVLLLLLRPVLSLHGVRYEKPILSVLIDMSRSMQVRDMPAGDGTLLRRVDALAESWRTTLDSRARLAERWDVQLWGFHATARRLSQWEAVADGDASALSDALRHATSVGYEVPAAVVLFSDGAENVARSSDLIGVAESLGSQDIALYGVGVGSPEPIGETRRIDVTNLATPTDVTAGARLEVAADVRLLGQQDRPVRVELLWDGRPVDAREIRADGPREAQHVVLTCVAESAGFHRVEVRATAVDVEPARHANDEAPPGESHDVETPQRHSGASPPQFVHVRDEGLNVLIIEAHPRHETAFVTRALAGDQRLRVQTRWAEATDDRPSANPLPRDVDEWSRFHLVILGDLVRRDLTRARLEALIEAVTQRGVGLIVLSGPREMEVWRSAPLSDLSPTRFDSKSTALRDARVVPTESGLRHPAGRLGAALSTGAAASDDRRAWSLLPPTPTATALGSSKPTADVLATDASGEPLLAAMAVGKGRVASVGFDGTWTWCMRLEEGRAVHGLFWRQLALWAAGRMPSAYIRSEQPQYEWAALRGGEAPIRVEARAADPFTGSPPEGARASATLRPIGANAPGTMSAPAPSSAPTEETPEPMGIPLTRDGDHWTGECRVSGPGEYELELEVELEETPSDEAGGEAAATPRKPTGDGAASATRCIRAAQRFVVRDSDLELLAPEADLQLLEQAANATGGAGGAYFPLKSWPRLLMQLVEKDRRRAVQTTRRIDLAAEGRAAVWFALLLLLSLEWAIRKRRGYV